MLALRDSRATLRQNSTIERLTYLTIADLPISLIAVGLPWFNTLYRVQLTSHLGNFCDSRWTGCTLLSHGQTMVCPSHIHHVCGHLCNGFLHQAFSAVDHISSRSTSCTKSLEIAVWALFSSKKERGAGWLAAVSWRATAFGGLQYRIGIGALSSSRVCLILGLRG